MKSGESKWCQKLQKLERCLSLTTIFTILIMLVPIVVGDAAVEMTAGVRKVILGHSVQLPCYSENFTPDMDFYIVQWRKQGSPSPVLLWRDGQASREGRGYEGRVALLSRAALTIVDLRRTDKGVYECQTWDVNGHPLGNGTSSEIDVLDVIPKFLQQPRDLLTAAGSLAEFTCLTDPPANSVTWWHDDRPMNGSEPGVSVVPSGERLQIHIGQDLQVQQRQQGIYVCVVAWENAALRSVDANLTVAGIAPFREQETVRITGREGGYVVLPGYMPHSVPPAVPIVMHNGSILPQTTSRTVLMSSGNLHIQGLVPSDVGWYQFSAMNSVTGERVTARNSVQLLMTSPEKSDSPQLLAAPKESNTVTVGGNVTLECAASGNPTPRIAWNKYGGVLPDGRYQQVLGNLLLFNLRLNDTGTYVCEADNGVGFPVSTISTLTVLEAPDIHKWVSEYEVREREEVVLECNIRGHARPAISWMHNGSSIEPSESRLMKDSKLIIKAAQRSHAGFYQCFAANGAEVVHATALLRVIPRSASNEEVLPVGLGGRKDHGPPLIEKGWERTKNTTFTLAEDDADQVDEPVPEEDWHSSKKHRNRKKKKKHKPSNEDVDKVLMVPPTRPEVTKLSDESVMVRWDVPPNTGLQILFFKVQYKDITKPHLRWMTIDEDIAAHILSYEVPNLRTGHVYRFRIAAVYSNHDNKLGPNSHKFTLQKDPPMKKPVVGPTIVHAEAISPSAVMIRWQYLDIEEVPIEGFFIYYRSTTSAGAYTKVTVLGANTPSHIISHLLPETAYDFKMQCFNSAGTSDFSNIRTEKTLASSQSVHDGEMDSDSETKGHRRLPAISDTAASDQLLYTILGSVLGSLTIAFVLFVSYCSWKQKQRKRRQTINSTHNKENGNVTDNGKYMAVNGSPANGHIGSLNGVLMWSKGPLRGGEDCADHTMMETSLIVSPAIGINNNEEHRQRHRADIELEFMESDDESEGPNGHVATGACKPLIHSEEAGSEDATSEEEEDDEDGESDNSQEEEDESRAASIQTENEEQRDGSSGIS